MTLELTVVVPAFNEDHRLAAGMRRLDAAVTAGAVDLDRTDLVVVDDGSGDHTAAVAEKLLAPLPHHRVIRLPVNQGKGAAVRAGIASARTPFVAFMDADMAIDPLAIPLLLDGLEQNDVVVGSRALADSMVETTYVVRTLISRLFNEVVTTGTGLGLKDTQCGFKAFRTPVARLLFHLVRIDRFAFDVEVLARARRLGLEIGEVPVHWKHVEGSTVHPLHDSVTMVSDVYRSRRGLLDGPPVPTIGVRPAPGSSGAGLRDQVGTLLHGLLDGAPVSVLPDGEGVVALLALIDAATVSRALSALRHALAPADVTLRALSVDGLTTFGPLAGRLDAVVPPSADGRRRPPGAVPPIAHTPPEYDRRGGFGRRRQDRDGPGRR